MTNTLSPLTERNHLPLQRYTFIKVSRAMGKDGLGERWAKRDVNPTLTLFDLTSDSRAVTIIVTKRKDI